MSGVSLTQPPEPFMPSTVPSLKSMQLFTPVGGAEVNGVQVPEAMDSTRVRCRISVAKSAHQLIIQMRLRMGLNGLKRVLFFESIIKGREADSCGISVMESMATLAED